MTRISPADGAVALRGLPRRCRALFVGLSEDESSEDLAHRVGPDGLSAVDHVVAVTRTITFLGQALHQVLTTDEPVLHPAVADRAQRAWDTPEGPVDDRIDELAAAADELAELADRAHARDWLRSGRVAGSGVEVTAEDLLSDAVESAVEHLRAADRTLTAVR